MTFIDKSRFRFQSRRDVCVGLPNGTIKLYPACFIEEHLDGSITLHARDKSIEYRRHEFREWFLDDIQIEEPD